MTLKAVAKKRKKAAEMNEKNKQFFESFFAGQNIILLTMCGWERKSLDMTHVKTKKKNRILQVNAKTCSICFVLHNPVGVTLVCININFDPLRITPSALGLRTAATEQQSQLPTGRQYK